MKYITILFSSFLITLSLFSQIPAPDTLIKPGSIEFNKGSIKFLKVENPVFAWDFETRENQINLINIDEERLFQINPNGNAIFGDTLSNTDRFKLTLTSPGDGEDYFSVAGPNPAAMLRLVELQETKFARIHFNNKFESEYWQFQSRSSIENPEIRFYWSDTFDPGNNSFLNLPSHSIMSIQPGKLMVNGTSPEANLHIVQTAVSRHPHGSMAVDDIGLGIENYDGTALWRLQVGVDDLAIIFNETHMGSFSASSGFYNPSDARLKNHINDIGSVLDEILLLKPISYFYNHDVNASKKSYGFLAQEVQEVFPDLVRKNQQNGLSMINYDQFIPILTEGIKELKALIEMQQEQINLLLSKQIAENN